MGTTVSKRDYLGDYLFCQVVLSFGSHHGDGVSRVIGAAIELWFCWHCLQLNHNYLFLLVL